MIESAFMTRRLGVLVALCALAATASADKPKAKKAPPPAQKQTAPEPPPADDQPADDGASDADAGSAGDIEAQLPPHVTGPKLVDLGNDIEIDLPAGMVLLEHDEAKKLIEKGGGTGEGVVALVLPMFLPDQTWEMRIDYDDVGYVKDTDADELDPNELFNQYKQGTDEDNARRRAQGLSELFLDGWQQMPKYDKPTHRLVWGFNAHSVNGPNVNFFTRVLGRNGYLSVDLIDDPDKIETAKGQAAGVVAGLRYKPGATYEDHKSNDKDSGMGLKALVLGGAAVGVFKVAKAGVLVKLLLIFKKGFIVVIAAIGAFFKKIFGRGGSKKTPPTQLPPDGPPVG
jgi:uncharacterized membrane-anchored protein